MTMNIPVINCPIQRLGQFIQGLETLSFERHRTELLPPGFDQVSPACIIQDEHDLDVWPGRQHQSDLTNGVNAQVVFDEQSTISRKTSDHALQQLDVAGAIPAGTHEDGSFSSSRFKQAMHPQLTSATTIGFKSGPVRTQLPFFALIGLDRNRPHFIQAQRSDARQMRDISRNGAPLFSTNSGSCLAASWNQLSWRFHTNPSAFSHSQIVESDRCVAALFKGALQPLQGPQLEGVSQGVRFLDGQCDQGAAYFWFVVSIVDRDGVGLPFSSSFSR
jgi:hypothetical protein